MRKCEARTIIALLCAIFLLVGTPYQAKGYDNNGQETMAEEEASGDGPQERKATRKERRRELVEATVGAVAIGIITGISGAGKPAQGDVGSPARNDAGAQNPARERLAGDYAITCSKCGYSAGFFPYADSSRKSIKCPECGGIKRIR